MLCLKFSLFGTGSNDFIYNKQKVVAEEIQKIFPNRIQLFRVPIRFCNKDNHEKYIKNKLSRARGVVFTILGSACAYLMGENTLYLYENGIGAINLPYRQSDLGLAHSRSVHPKTLMMVDESKQWQYLTEEYPEFDDIVDQTCQFQNISADEMRIRLMKLYKTYVQEWKMVQDQLMTGMIKADKS
ncbi:hypothetical protein [Spirulina subsalsa]|uniref:hypothetical protein n=1 Tax=Spirulina subsalsa TaxID=54311 RepID=UPI00035DE6E8|nr:hypothetical protein [Spirulina subsalsa]